MDLSRRNFLIGGLGLVGYYLTQPELWSLAAQAANLAPRRAGESKVLVVVQLTGGNDGLNTVVPYNAGAYYQVRPTLAIKPSEAIALTDQIGLHPSLKHFADLYRSNKLAIVQGVGYPNPSRSHFKSIEIWQTAEPERLVDTGWLGRFLDLSAADGKASANNPLPAVNVDPKLPMSLMARKVSVPSVANVADFPFSSSAAYPNGDFGRRLRFISQMIAGGVNARVYNISLDGFDTHTLQSRTQAALLKQLSEGLSAFQADMEAHGVDRDVLVLAFSEFGRRVAENSGRGTDHGAAQPVFIVGSSVKAGIHGDHPSLTQLDDGDLRHKVDFRSIYATILDRWLAADSRQILGANYDQLNFV